VPIWERREHLLEGDVSDFALPGVSHPLLIATACLIAWSPNWG
jgi:hypothetical protein